MANMRANVGKENKKPRYEGRINDNSANCSDVCDHSGVLLGGIPALEQSAVLGARFGANFDRTKTNTAAQAHEQVGNQVRSSNVTACNPMNDDETQVICHILKAFTMHVISQGERRK